MSPIYPVAIAGGVVVLGGVLIIVFRAGLSDLMTRFHDDTIRATGQQPEENPQLTPLTRSRALVWGAGVACAGVLMILAGIFRCW